MTIWLLRRNSRLTVKWHFERLLSNCIDENWGHDSSWQPVAIALPWTSLTRLCIWLKQNEKLSFKSFLIYLFATFINLKLFPSCIFRIVWNFKSFSSLSLRLEDLLPFCQLQRRNFAFLERRKLKAILIHTSLHTNQDDVMEAAESRHTVFMITRRTFSVCLKE